MHHYSAGERVCNRFSIEALAGQGGMGAVYRARDDQTGGRVALKLAGALTSGNEARFEREADLLAALDHPGIVRHVAHGLTESGEFYLAMEWLEGEDLETRLRTGPLGPHQAVALALRVAETLAAIHGRGIVHRDIKPSNLFLPDGSLERPKLLDFGIARRSGAAALTRTGTALGTPQYMSPEQVRASRDVDARADIFSLGAVLFECLTGRPPFGGEHAMAVLAKVLLDDPPRVAELAPDLPPAVDEIVTSMLAKRPEHRPNDAVELGRALERCSALLDAGSAATVVHARPALVGRERRLLCVVLASDRSAGVDETLSTDQLSDYTGRLRAIVAPHGGELALLGGQQILVTVPATGVATDQAMRAARAALALSEELPRAAVSLAMAGADDSEGSISGVIDRAAHLLAGEGQRIRIDEVTAGLIGVRFRIASAAGGFELLGEREPGEQPRPVLGRATECVGRERELSVLEGIVDEALAESSARAILVTGPPGVGKSRLRYELARRVGEGDLGHDDLGELVIWTARAEAMRSGSPLDLLAQLVRAATSLEGADPATARQRLKAHVMQQIEREDDRRGVAEFLGEIVGAAFPDADNAALAAARGDARIMGDQMLGAWLALLRAQLRSRPLLLALEDLHWGDAQTVRFLDAALRELRDRPLIVLALARPDVHDRFVGLWQDRALEELRLRPLSARACERLVRQLLGDVGAETLERLVRHAEGNPLYLEEMIRAAAAGRLDALPGSVVAMMQARLESLEAAERRVLRTASLFGESFRPDALVALISGQAPGDDAFRHLENLIEREVLIRRRGASSEQDVFAFRHALVREAAYAMLTEEDRRLGHRFAAEWLERNGEPDALLLAEHFDRAGDAASAARSFAQAARQALEKTDFEAALERAARAIDLGATGATLLEARAVRGEALSCAGRFTEAVPEVVQALALSPPDEARIPLLRRLSTLGLVRQDGELLRRAGEGLRSMALAGGRGELVAESGAILATAGHVDGRCAESLAGIFEALAAHPEELEPSAMLGMSVWSLYHFAHYAECERWTGRSLRHAENVGDWQAAVILEGNRGLSLVGLGRYSAAEDCFENARTRAARVGLPALLARSVSMSAGYLADVFDDGASEARLEECRSLCATLEFSAPSTSATLELISILIRRRELARAAELLAAVAPAAESGSGFHGWLWRARLAVVRAELAAARKEWEAALAAATTAEAECRKVLRVKYAVVSRVVQARALAALGRANEAVDVLRSTCEEARSYADPLMLLRPSLELQRLAPDSGVLAELTGLADAIEQALPHESPRAKFRAAPELRLLG